MGKTGVPVVKNHCKDQRVVFTLFLEFGLHIALGEGHTLERRSISPKIVLALIQTIFALYVKEIAKNMPCERLRK